jgi:anti-sigma factor RsiW
MNSIERTDPWLDRLSEYLDDELSSKERAELEHHLAVCTDCAAVLDDLRQVVAQAGHMEREAVPARDLWPAIEARLTPKTTRVASSGRSWRLGLAAAALFVLACAALVWLLAGQRAERAQQAAAPESAEREYEKTVANLQREARQRLTLDPHVVEVLDENLATLDAAIATYREALSQEPADGDLRTRLRQAERRKLEVLQQAVALAADGTE